MSASATGMTLSKCFRSPGMSLSASASAAPSCDRKDVDTPLRTHTRHIILSALLAVASAVAAAQDYPAKPIRIVVPVPPGGANDTLTRIIAPKLSESVRQPVIVENRPGANTTLGTATVAKAPADGYTLLSAPSAHTVNAVLYNSLPYDPLKDFTPVCGLAAAPLLLTVHPSLPVKSVKDLIALAKSRPGQLNYASPGNGTSGHLAGELFKSVAGIQMVHVPYKGAGPATTDLVGGHVLVMFPTFQAATPFVKAGKLRALAQTSAARSSLASDIPTMAEAGLAGVEINSWFGILGPAGLPRDVVARLDSDIRKILQMRDVSERLQALAYDAFYMSPERYASFMRSDLAKWTRVIREAGIRAE
jgi:tripartite-type tricarboxylate transporter receptor subunit TctC